jgi:L-fucose mutarotase/ribose pyranase (RbsD/FucU family)
MPIGKIAYFDEGRRFGFIIPDELEQISKIWGAQFADCLITDARWPSCNQTAAVVAAGAVVKSAIDGIARILDVGDFAPHIEMMSTTMHNAFWDSMPSRKEQLRFPRCASD